MTAASSEHTVDVAIVGAGIVGLAHAWEAAKRGQSVVVFERDRQAMGASIRNFGMILPLGMAPGIQHERALRSRAAWLSLLYETDLWHQKEGVLVVAYHEDEEQAMQEFLDWGPPNGYAVSWLDRQQVAEKSPVETTGLRGGLFSNIEILVDPREVLHVLPAFLAEQYGVQFVFGAAVTGISYPYIEAGGRQVKAERMLVCSGSDTVTLFPEQLTEQDLMPCKLQMMQTEAQPAQWKLGPMLATGLSLTHYASFAACSSVTAIKARIQEHLPELEEYGIHILVAQHAAGRLMIGDSHVYDEAITPFDSKKIDRLILDQLSTFLAPPITQIRSNWHGVYLKTKNGLPLILSPSPEVRVVTGMGGGGMTTSFALAEDVFEAWA